MHSILWFVRTRRRARSLAQVVGALATFAFSTTLLFCANAAAQTGAQRFASFCSGCHNNVAHPLNLVYNAAGNAAIIKTVNELGMGAHGTVDDFESIASYLDAT